MIHAERINSQLSLSREKMNTFVDPGVGGVGGGWDWELTGWPLVII